MQCAWLILYQIKCVQKKSRLTNCRFTTISSQISAIYMTIFHKPEVQTVILRCWMGLYLNWFKSYDTKCNFSIFVLVGFCKKKNFVCTVFGDFCVFCVFVCFSFWVISFEPIKIQTHSLPQNGRLNFSFVKDIHVDVGNLAWNSCKMAICQSTFFLDTL